MACSPVIAITGGQGDQPRYRHAYQNAEDFDAWDARHEGELQRRHRRAPARPPAPGLPHRDDRARRGRCTSSCAATRGQMLDRRGRLRPRRSRSGIVASPPFVPSPSDPRYRGGGRAAVTGVAADHRRRRRRRVVGAGPEVVKLAERLSIPVATSLQREGDHPGRPPAGRRRARQLLALVRQHGRRRGRPRVLHRQPHRRPGDERLADPEDRHADDPARHRTRRARPQLPERRLDPRRRAR